MRPPDVNFAIYLTLAMVTSFGIALTRSNATTSRVS